MLVCYVCVGIINDNVNVCINNVGYVGLWLCLCVRMYVYNSQYVCVFICM